MRRILGLAAAFLLAACTTGSGGGSTPSVGTSTPMPTPSGTLAPSATGASPSVPAATAVTTPSAVVTPVPRVEGTGVTIYDETSGTPDVSAQFELVTEAGRHVYIDTVLTSAFARKPTADDVLLITHFHPDHEDASVIAAFPGKKIVGMARSLVLPDVHITGIPSAHAPGDPETGDGATNVMFLIEIGGLRLLHMGDLGQEALNPEQQALIGRIDVAFGQLENDYSAMGAGSEKGFNLVKQVDPLVFIPTHLWGDAALAAKAAKTWPAKVAKARSIHVTVSTLPRATTILFMGYNAEQYAAKLKLPKAAW